MKTYKVTIRAFITKEYEIEAENEDQAIEQGHDSFSVLCDGAPERYDQELVDVEEIEAAE